MPSKKTPFPRGKMVHVYENVFKVVYPGRKPPNVYYIQTACSNCGAEKYQNRANFMRSKETFCSPECRREKNRKRMEGTVKFKRGSTVRGPKLVYLPDHPHAKKNFVPLHRHVVEQHMGRILEVTETVHHIDCNAENNSIDNLFVFQTKSEHFLAHGSLNRCVEHLLKIGVLYFNRETKRYSCENLEDFLK